MRFVFDMEWLRRGLLVFFIAAGLVFGGCGIGVDSTPSTSTTVRTVVDSSIEPTSSSIRQKGEGLYQLWTVDPRTLEPIEGGEFDLSGDWVSGTMSPNHRWIVTSSQTEDKVTHHLVDVAATTVVAQFDRPIDWDRGGVTFFPDDGGAIYTFHYGTGSTELRVVDPLTGVLSTVLVFPSTFQPHWERGSIVDGRLLWYGTHTEDGEYQAAIAMGELTTGVVEVFPLPLVGLQGDRVADFGDWEAGEWLDPAVVWDLDRDRVLIVHPDETKVTVFDLVTRETTSHEWSTQTSWFDRLFAYWFPSAHAKGPQLRTTRSAVLSPDGDRLYIATEGSEIIYGDGLLASGIRVVPEGLVVVDTSTWLVVAEWPDISRIVMSPDGKYVVGSGMGGEDRLGATSYAPRPSVLIATNSLDVIGSYEVSNGGMSHDVSFSADGEFLYLVAEYRGWVQVVELASGEIVGHLPIGTMTAFFGEVGLLTVRR